MSEPGTASVMVIAWWDTMASPGRVQGWPQVGARCVAVPDAGRARVHDIVATRVDDRYQTLA